MVQASMFPIVVAIMSLEYDIERNKYSWFKFTDNEKDFILSVFEPYRYLEPAMHSMGHVIHQLAPDPTELSFLCGLHLIDCGLFVLSVVDDCVCTKMSQSLSSIATDLPGNRES